MINTYLSEKGSSINLSHLFYGILNRVWKRLQEIWWIVSYINCLSVNIIKLLKQNILKFIIKTYYSPTDSVITAASDVCAVSVGVSVVSTCGVTWTDCKILLLHFFLVLSLPLICWSVLSSFALLCFVLFCFVLFCFALV